MIKYFIAISYIILSTISVFYIHKISPTDMAGPGFDILVYFLTVFVSVVFCGISIKKVQNGSLRSYVYFYINALGLILISVAVCYALNKKG